MPGDTDRQPKRQQRRAVATTAHRLPVKLAGIEPH
jgi:hypothetical protein